MPKLSFSYNKATVSIRAKIGRDELDSPWIMHDLLESITSAQNIEVEEIHNFEWARLSWFVDMLMCSTVSGDLGISWPENIYTETPESIFECYNALMEGDAELVKVWRSASKKSNLETTSPEE